MQVEIENSDSTITSSLISDIVEFVNDAFANCFITDSLIKAHIALIPKGDILDTIQKFRPNSLLNVAYKVLSEVTVNRIMPPYFRNCLVSSKQLLEVQLVTLFLLRKVFTHLDE
ncbi:hypothetical protein SLEP1_g18927 [Rubroshorea leprosula]|uniref:Uncharacterized protein n=1 Tax=Rubroshorea leprosula TaxID=152421 RepID=A0AAV5J826_9ROSI|nr:hypothetical protein SLEP1_g18927 [Rubroshorea leprosula]